LVDILIKDLRVVDGTGNPWYKADMAIACGKIQAIGSLGAVSAGRTINAGGLVACPGFVDIHSHSDRSLVAHNKGIASLQQGITTQIGGNCGHSLAPIRAGGDGLSKLAEEHGFGQLELEWTTFDEYLTWQERRGTGINFAPLLGHGALRRYVMGPEGEGGERRDPTAAELESMQQEVAKAMEAGAYGLSTGLEYPPGRNATTGELVALCRVVASYDGLYATHMRSEGYAPGMEWWGAVVEALEIGRRAEVRVNISHLKADQRRAWDKVDAVLRLLEDARRHGISVTADLYPWPYAAVGYMIDVLPPHLGELGLPELLRRLADPAARQAIREEIDRGIPEWTNPSASFGWGAIGVVETSDPADEGKSVEDLAEERGTDPLDVCFELLLRDQGLTRSSVGVMAEANIEKQLRHPLTMVSTDGFTVDMYPTAKLPQDPSPKLHPRTVATYPRLLERYVRQRGTLPLEQAIRKATSLPAAVTGLTGRGLLTPGMWADVVLLDPETVGETGSFSDPHHPPRGINWVLVNGQVAIDQGQPTGVLAGRVLRRGHRQAD